MSETYQGGHCGFMPDEYAVSLVNGVINTTW